MLYLGFAVFPGGEAGGALAAWKAVTLPLSYSRLQSAACCLAKMVEAGGFEPP